MTRNLYLGADLDPAIEAKGLQRSRGRRANPARRGPKRLPDPGRGLAKEILEEAAGPGRPAGGRALAHRAPGPSPRRRDPTRRRSATTTCRHCSARSTAGKGKGQRQAPVRGRRRPARVRPRSAGRRQRSPRRRAPGPAGRRGDQRPADDARRDPRLGSGVAVQTWNEQGANFANLLDPETPRAVAHISVKRGWTAIDAKVRGSQLSASSTPTSSRSTPLTQAQNPCPAGSGSHRAARRRATCRRPARRPQLRQRHGFLPGTSAYRIPARRGHARAQHQQTARLLPQVEPAGEVGQGGNIADFDHQVDHVMTATRKVKLKSSAVTGRTRSTASGTPITPACSAPWN